MRINKNIFFIPALLALFYYLLIVVPSMIEGNGIKIYVFIFQLIVTLATGFLFSYFNIFVMVKINKVIEKYKINLWLKSVIIFAIICFCLFLVYILHETIWLFSKPNLSLFLLFPFLSLFGGTVLYFLLNIPWNIRKKNIMEWLLCMGISFAASLIARTK